MKNKYFYILFFIVFITSCTGNKENVVKEDRFPVLSYNAEISETLNLNTANIRIDSPKKIGYWSQHYQNPQNNLNNLATLSTLKNEKKIISSKKGPINIIQPIYFDNQLCHVISTGHLECINTKNNESIFKISLKSQSDNKYEVFRGGIAYFDGKIVFVDAYGQVKSINSNNGEINWQVEIDFPILSPPLIYRDYIYFITADNRIYSLNFENGDIEWTFQTIEESKKNLFTASPVAYENIIIAPFSNGDLISFIYDQGRPIWSENVSKASLISNFALKDIAASPVIAGTEIISLSSHGKIISVNVINGQRNWSVDISGYRTPIVSGNQIYLIDEDGRLICLDRTSGDIYWISNLGKFRKGNKIDDLNMWLGPYLLNNLLYTMSYFGDLKIISPITGEIVSQRNVGINKIIIDPIITNDTVFITDENSNVYTLK